MRHTLLLSVFVVFLFGCHGESVTGPPMGSNVLTGQVVTTGDLGGSSPAGISVTCSGQISVTDAQGRFAFASLSPASTQLTVFATGNFNMRFTRGDGIDAGGSVSSSASDVVVYLQRSRAVIVSTGRAKRELEGLITAISATSITVNDASTHGEVTAAIDSNTVIRKGNQTLAATDLKVNDRVHVKASVGTDGTLTAFEIMLQQSASDDDGPGQTRELEGTIAAISSTSIKVNNASTGTQVEAAITSSTIIRKGNQTLTTDDLKVGDRVHVKTVKNTDGSLTAREIMLQNPGD